MSVFTFLDEYDFLGKTIIPFCSHEGSGLVRSEKDIVKLCPEATISKGIAIHGTSAGSAGKSVVNWLDKIRVILILGGLQWWSTFYFGIV